MVIIKIVHTHFTKYTNTLHSYTSKIAMITMCVNKYVKPPLCVFFIHNSPIQMRATCTSKRNPSMCSFSSRNARAPSTPTMWPTITFRWAWPITRTVCSWRYRAVGPAFRPRSTTSAPMAQHRAARRSERSPAIGKTSCPRRPATVRPSRVWCRCIGRVWTSAIGCGLLIPDCWSIRVSIKYVLYRPYFSVRLTFYSVGVFLIHLYRFL